LVSEQGQIKLDFSMDFSMVFPKSLGAEGPHNTSGLAQTEVTNGNPDPTDLGTGSHDLHDIMTPWPHLCGTDGYFFL
jgi:hypothetical protein